MRAPRMPVLTGRTVARGPVRVSVEFKDGRAVRVSVSHVRFGRLIRDAALDLEEMGPPSGGNAPGATVLPFRGVAA